MITFLLPSLAVAGTYTDAPGALQGDISIGNDFLSSSDQMYQQDQSVGNRKQYNNDIRSW